MRPFLSTRRFFLSGKNKISILNPCSGCYSLLCSMLYKLAILVLLCLLALLLLQSERKKLKAGEPAPAARIFCIISTHDFRHDSTAVHIKRTWSKRCDHHLFVSNDAHAELEPAVFLKLNDKWEEMRAHFKYVNKYHFDEGDWFLYANDDNYVVIENLRHMLLPYSPDEPIYFGCKLRSTDNQTYMYERSPIVLSRGALRKFVLRALPDHTLCSSAAQGPGAYEELGRCLSNVNVLAGDSRDHLGYHRFLPFQMTEHFAGPLNSSVEHHKNFMQRSYYELIDSAMPISRQLISTRHEYIPNIYNFYYFSYNVKLFGMTWGKPWNGLSKYPN